MPKRYVVQVNDKEFDVEVLDLQGHQACLRINGAEYTTSLSAKPLLNLASQGPVLGVPVAPASAPRRSGSVQSPNTVTAPMPGLVVKVLVKEGDPVLVGGEVVVLEAMKMENAVPAHQSGRVTKVHVKSGDQVEAGGPLLDIGVD